MILKINLSDSCVFKCIGCKIKKWIFNKDELETILEEHNFDSINIFSETISEDYKEIINICELAKKRDIKIVIKTISFFIDIKKILSLISDYNIELELVFTGKTKDRDLLLKQIEVENLILPTLKENRIKFRNILFCSVNNEEELLKILDCFNYSDLRIILSTKLLKDNILKILPKDINAIEITKQNKISLGSDCIDIMPKDNNIFFIKKGEF